jgi:hypothetical protein
LPFADLKKLLLDGFALSGGATKITNFADSVRKKTLKRIENVADGDSMELENILKDTMHSTGTDLNKAENSKTQTAFALDYVSKAQMAADEAIPMTIKERLETLWSLRGMKKQ